MKEIQFNKDLSPEQWELYHETSIRDIGLSMRTHNVMGRAGYYTLGDLVDTTASEILDAISHSRVEHDRNFSERALKQVEENLKQKGLRLLTDEEKQNVLNSLTETERLQREILILRYEKEMAESRRVYAEERLERLTRERKDKDERTVQRIEQILKTNPNPLPEILKNMVYRDSNIPLCIIFELNKQGCKLEQYYDDNKSLNDCCEKCIEEFLRSYLV